MMNLPGSAQVLTVTGLLALSIGTPTAQQMRLWTFDALRQKSDLVVVARPSVIRDTGIRAAVKGFGTLPVVEMNTEFKVLSTLKGDPPKGALVLRHYRVDSQRTVGACAGCGTQLDFSSNGPMAGRCRENASTSVDLDVPPGGWPEPACAYLMFLLKDGEGFFAPTSGQLDPYSSVFILRAAR